MPSLLELKVKTKVFAKKTKQFAKAVIGNSLFQLLLIALILLPFSYLNLQGWYELLYVIFGLALFLTFLIKKDESLYFALAVVLFIIAFFLYSAIVGPLPLLKPSPLINFFIFFSFDFMLANIIYVLFR